MGGGWSSAPFSDPVYALQHGCITPYAQYSADEDMCETLSTYVVNSQETWDNMMLVAGAEGAAAIQNKLDMVRNYLKASFNFSLDELRDAVQRRQTDFLKGKVDITDLSVGGE